MSHNPVRDRTAGVAPQPAANAVNSRPANAHLVKAVASAANAYIVSHYPFGFLGGTPCRLRLDGRGYWIVPIFLTSPGYGAVGEVGFVALNARTRKVAGSTPRDEVVAAGKRLREAKRDELEAAFHRARTT
jgi:hypothetical protein